MATDPVTILYKPNISKKQLHTEFFIQMRKHKKKSIRSLRSFLLMIRTFLWMYCPVYDIIDNSLDNKKIAIYGLGFVGLTLGLVMANKGFEVIGFDKDDTIIENLKDDKPSFL